MTGMHMISCIRFSLQLLITESIYTFGLGQFTRNYTQTTKRGLLTTNKG